eukprot:Colp12_sorted_trinity150504_noHs@24330
MNLLAASRRLIARAPIARTYSTSVSKGAVIELVNLIQNRENVDYFLQHYKTEENKLALIKTGGSVLEDHLDILTDSLKLLKTFGVHPIVMHGGGPQLNKTLEAAGIVPDYINGIRITDAKTLEIAQKVFAGENNKVTKALTAAGLPVKPFIGGIFVAELLDFSKWQYVGKVTSINKDNLEGAIAKGEIPVISSLAATPEGQVLNINADTAASELGKAIKPWNTVYLNTTGGMLNGETKETIHHIDVDGDYEHLMKQAWVKYGTRLKINEIRDLLHALPKDSIVTITSTPHLPKMLVNGRGEATTFSRGPLLQQQKRSYSTSSRKKRLGVIGARGYVGRELVKLVDNHSTAEVALVSSRQLEGKSIKEAFDGVKLDLTCVNIAPEELHTRDDIDCWVLALPNGLAAPYVKAVQGLKHKPVVVDLSADYRFDDTWQYGFPERFREQIRKAQFISNPGCYATGAQVATLP